MKAVNAVSAALKSFIVLPVLTSKPALNLFKPPNVWVPVLTKPLLDASAVGKLNVCEEPAEEIAKSEPDKPTSKVWSGNEIPFNNVIPDPEPP